MKRTIIAMSFAMTMMLVGCDSLRFAPSESQKQNAWLHHRASAVAAETAARQDCSEELVALTKLTEQQGRAFVADYGLPGSFPQADTAEQILQASNFELAASALEDSGERPDIFAAANSVFDLAIAVSALLGGVYGTKAVRFLTQARQKSKALQEIIAGNELFKTQNEDSRAAFKQAQENQSAPTRALVAVMKSPQEVKT